MVRGILVATEGMIAQSNRASVYSNNLSNVSTCGFKRDEIGVNSSFTLELRRIDDGKNSSRPVIGSLNIPDFKYHLEADTGTGSTIQTGNPLDLLIDGSGYFAVQGKDAKDTIYTRNGNFTLNTKGELVTQEGFNVLGEKGPVVIPSGQKITIDEDGRIVSDGKILDKILIKTFPSLKGIIKTGSSFFIPPENTPVQSFSGRVKQGYIEGSNVNTVKEMINLLEAHKAYQANEKAIRAEMDALKEAVTNVGRVG
ncbi:MAG: flagellar hook-basal body protein [Candidatus Eremiobacterota bacterium]